MMCAKNDLWCGRCGGGLYLSEGYDAVTGLDFHTVECEICGEMNSLGGAAWMKN